jgi:hypothetical protein
VAVTADLESLIFGQITSDDNTRTIRSLRFSGFEDNKSYSVLLFDEKDNITSPSEGRNLIFVSSADSKSLSLTYQPSAPNVFAQVKTVGGAAQVTMYFSRVLRNTQESDEDATGMVTVTSGAGTLSAQTISSDRRSMTLIYTPAPNEERATIRFSHFTADVNQATGSEFPISKSITMRFGQKATAEKNISPVLGGEVSLAETANDPSNVTLPANALLTSTGGVTSVDSNYPISFSSTEDLAATAATPALRSMALSTQLKRGAGAFLSEAYAAMQAAKATANINPLSSFYSVLLPEGLSHTLNQTAKLTLNYADGSDPTKINVYYYEPLGQRYLLESQDRVIDTVNRTITVGVRHFSTFVVLEKSAAVVQTVTGDTSTGGQLEVFNFPNPFDLQSKTKTLARTTSATDMTTEGTIIRYSIPSNKAGPAKIVIYNVVGEKVREINLGTPAAGSYQYVEWDGRNDSGNKVASGVYIGELKVGSEKKFWKMAVIK